MKAFDIKIFIQRSVKELISGYQDPLLKFISTVDPKIVSDDHFGLFYGVL
jgi:hypothetical protein